LAKPEFADTVDLVNNHVTACSDMVYYTLFIFYIVSKGAPLVETKLCHLQYNWMAPWKNRTSRYISFFSSYHSVVFYFRCSV